VKAKRINQLEFCSTEFKNSFHLTAENQPVVFAKQSVVYSSNYKLQAKTDLKR